MTDIQKRMKRLIQMISVSIIFFIIILGLQPRFNLNRQQVIILTIFGSTYLLIILSHGNERTIIAMFGAFLMWVFGALPSGDIVNYVDLHAIGLFFGVMIIAGVLKTAGFFKYVSNLVVRYTKMDARLIFIALTTITAILSAFLDEISVIIFMTSITIYLCEALRLDPKPFILTEIFTANIGGSLTAVGSPPNIMILTAGNLSFMDFLRNMSPIVIPSFFFFIITILFLYRKEFKKKPWGKIEPFKIKDKWLFSFSIVIFICMTVLLLSHSLLGLHPTTIVMATAIIALFIGGKKMNRMFKEVHWPTLLFFISLFVLVGGLEATGILELVAKAIFDFAGTDKLLATSAILWTSAILSAVIDNIPLVAAFIPIIKNYSLTSGIEPYILWWALAMGAGLGANGTPISGSANILALSEAERQNHKISSKDFIKLGVPLMFGTLLMAQAILLFKFYL